MNIDEILTSASCDLKIASGHSRNRNIVAMRQNWEAAITRIDAVIAFCDEHNIEQHYKLENLIKYSTSLHDDLMDSESMLNYFNNIKDLPNARTEELI